MKSLTKTKNRNPQHINICKISRKKVKIIFKNINSKGIKKEPPVKVASYQGYCNVACHEIPLSCLYSTQTLVIGNQQPGYILRICRFLLLAKVNPLPEITKFYNSRSNTFSISFDILS